MPETPQRCWLVVGSHELKSSLHRPSRWQVSLLACPAEHLVPAIDGSRLYRIALAGWSPEQAIVLDQHGTVLDQRPAALDELQGHGPVVPLGLLRAAGDAVSLHAHVDSYAGQARFITVPGQPVQLAAAPTALLAAIDEHFLKVNNYLCFRVKLEPDVELEHKFTLVEHPDVWALAQQTLSMVAAGGLPGWLVEFREEIQGWDFLNHVYAIEAPDDEAGYVSFIPTTDGRHTVKRKIFSVDTDERPELRSRGVDVGAGFETYLTETMQLTPSWHASFRRVRYDVSVESIETGNVFGIAYDRSTIVDDDGRPIAGAAELTQCEIEYIYSQSLAPIDFDSVRADLGRLRLLMSGYFDQCSIENYQRHESKLTFLRSQHAAAR